MGKRYLLLIIAALLLMQSAFAVSNITVTLTTPSSGLTLTALPVAFQCSAVSPDAGGNTITSIELYTDTTGTWAANKTAAATSLSDSISGIPNGAYTWNCKATNNIGETNFWTSNFTFTVSVASSSLTFTGTIPNITFPEDTTLSNNITLSNYFSDSPTYSITGNTNVIPSISSGIVSFSATGNWSGTETLRVTATAGTLTNYSNYFTVTLSPVNDAPYYTTIPTQNMTKNTNHSLNLNSFFFDVEGSTLNYTISTAPSHMNVTISSNTVVFSPEPNWTGSTTVAFTASDGNASTTGNTLTLRVNGTSTNATANRVPSVSCPTGWPGIMAGESKTFTITKSDPDGDTLTVQWLINDEVVEGQTGDSFSFSKENSGPYRLKVIVSDGKSTRECPVWTIQVTSAADLNYTSESRDVASIISEQTEEVVRCGDGKIQEGEDCASCPSDVVCSSGEVCSKGVCTPKTSSSTVLIVIGIIIAVILGGGFAVYKLTTRRKIETTVRDGRTLSQVEKELPPMDLHDIYEKESPKADTDSIPQPVENPLDKYVHAMREKGVSDADIHKALKEKGWNDALIRQALKH